MSGKKRGKRRTRSQRLGEVGEALVQVWASKNGLSANPTVNDYGIDFFCHVFEENEGFEVDTGDVLKLQAKATGSKRRVRLNQEDAASLFKSTGPTGICAVDLRSNEVRHRLVDDGVLRELHALLSGNQKSKVFPFSWFHKQTQFRPALEKLCKPGSQARLRILRAELTLQQEIPGALIDTQTSSQDGEVRVQVPWFGDAIEIDSTVREQVRNVVLSRSWSDGALQPGVSLKSDVWRARKLSPKDGVWVGGRAGEEVNLSLSTPSGRVTAPFWVTRFDGELVYLHRKSGLCLGVGDSVSVKNNQFEQRLRVDYQKGTTNLQALGSFTTDFLCQLREGSVLSGEGKGIPVANWPSLLAVGRFVNHLKNTTAKLGLPLARFKLEEFGTLPLRRAAMFLDEVHNNNTSLSKIGFEQFSLTSESPIRRSVNYRIPVATQLGPFGVVSWFEGSGFLLLDGKGNFAGVELGKNTTVGDVVWKEETIAGEHPEVWIRENGLALPLGYRGRLSEWNQTSNPPTEIHFYDPKMR